MGIEHKPYRELFFTLKGRIPRSTFWLRFYVFYLLAFFLLGFVDARLGTIRPGHTVGAHQALLLVVALLPSIAVGVKRLHDRDRSGWLYILMLVPFVNIWIMVEMGLLKGTKGTNIYGPDPCEISRNSKIAR